MADTTKKLYTSDATTDAYEAAMTDLSSKLATTPTYSGTYDTELNNLYNKIANRASFSYDASEDGMYQGYLKRMMQNGKLAMRDTIGQASALTGGYGNTYAQAVGQQTYDQYLTQAEEALPDYYNMALSAYNAEGDRLNNLYSLVSDQRDTEYNQYRDALSDYNNNLLLAQEYENELYSRAQYADETEYERQKYEEETAYSRAQDEYSKQQTAYSQLSSIISSSGYTPSDDELTAAGMSRAQANALASEYQRQVALENEKMELSRYSTYNSGSSSSSNSSSGSSYSSVSSTPTATYAQNATFDTQVGTVSAQTYSDMSGNYSKVRSYLASLKTTTAKKAAVQNSYKLGTITSNDYQRLYNEIRNGTL